MSCDTTVEMIHPPAMHQQIGEYEDISSLGMDRSGSRERPLLLVHIVVGGTGGHILLGTMVMAAGEDAQSPIAGVSVVKVDKDGHHGVVFVGEVMIVLVRGEGCSLLGWLEVSLGVMQYNTGALIMIISLTMLVTMYAT